MKKLVTSIVLLLNTTLSPANSPQEPGIHIDSEGQAYITPYPRQHRVLVCDKYANCTKLNYERKPSWEELRRLQDGLEAPYPTIIYP